MKHIHFYKFSKALLESITLLILLVLFILFVKLFLMLI